MDRTYMNTPIRWRGAYSALDGIRIGILTIALAASVHAAVDVTSMPVSVIYEITSGAVAGTNTTDIVGGMWVSNATVGGASTSFSPGTPGFVTPAVPLLLGANSIRVYGSNTLGSVSSDSVNIWRYNIDGSGEPAGSKYSRRLRGSVVGWGNNDTGQTNCPAGTDFVGIAGGNRASLALKADGSLAGWSVGTPPEINCPPGTDFIAMASGAYHGLAVRNNGELAGWGLNMSGEINCPPGTDYAAVAGGSGFSIALRTDGSLVGWGANASLQTNCPAGNNYVAIAAGEAHALALQNDGTLVPWGDRGCGQDTCPPGSNFVAIAAGKNHSLALRNDGTLAGWGLNDYGQADCPAGSNYITIAGGDGYSLALRNNGTLVAWGDNTFGNTNCPAGNGYVACAAGFFHSLAIHFSPFVDSTSENATVSYSVPACSIAGTNTPSLDPMVRIGGTMWWTNACNGSNGTIAAENSWTIPAVPLSVGSNMITVCGTNEFGWTGSDDVCIVRTDPFFLDITNWNVRVLYDVTTVTLAGTNIADLVGNAWVSNASIGGAATSFARNGLSFTTPPVAVRLGANLIRIYGSNVLGVVSSDEIYAWRYTIDGSGEQTGSRYGRRLRGTLMGWGNNFADQTNCPGGNEYVGAAAGNCFSVVLKSDGHLAAWGINSYGQTNCPALNDCVAIAAGSAHTVALRADGHLVSWGWSTSGQTNCPPGSNYVAVAAGNAHSLALRDDGTLVAWGVNAYDLTNCPPGSNYVAVACGGSHCLALRNDGSLVSWGWNNYGQTDCPTDTTYLAIAGGSYHSLALRSDGALEGWGLNVYGQTTYPAGSNYVAVAAGTCHSLALNDQGTVAAWGSTNPYETNCPDVHNVVLIDSEADHSLAILFQPLVDITNQYTSLTYPTVTCDIAGTNMLSTDPVARIVGSLWWTNDANGVCGTITAAYSWTIPAVPLALGSNTITVSGTNELGWLGSDQVTVFRGGLGAPFLDITNVAATFRLDMAVFRFAGTNNVHIVGPMWVSNAAAGGAATSFARSGVWFITPPVSLLQGSNTIEVLGTNLLGDVVTDTVTIVRGLATDIFLVAPQDKLTTMYCTQSVSVIFGPEVVYRYLMTNVLPVFNTGAAFDYTNELFFAATGTYYWTALGYSGDTTEEYHATRTNRLTIREAVPAQIRLISPLPGAVMTNRFACRLSAEYCGADEGRQLSTNNGASWFDFDPACPVALPAVGMYQWTARGRALGSWWYAPTTNTLTITTNYSGARAIFMVTPAEGSVLTTAAPEFSTLTFGPAFTSTSLSTDDAAYTVVTFPTNLGMNAGTHFWRARGTMVPGPVHTYALGTNAFKLVDPSAASITLLEPADGEEWEPGFIHLDIMAWNVGSLELSTNNGVGWCDYESPFNMPEGVYEWTARATNAAGIWIYAPMTNSLTLELVPEPLVGCGMMMGVVLLAVKRRTSGGVRRRW